MKKKTSKKLIVAILLVTMLSQTLYSAAAGIFGLRTQTTAYADDEFVEDVEPGEQVDESNQEDGTEEVDAAEVDETEEQSADEDSAYEEEEAAADEEAAEEEEVREVPDVSLRISYVDDEGSSIKDTEDYDIDPDTMRVFRREAPDFEGYVYIKTTAYLQGSDSEIAAIYSEEVDGVQVFSITTDEDIDNKSADDVAWTELTEDSVIVMHYDKTEEETVSDNTVSENTVSENEAEPVKREYEYEDDSVYAKATLEKADAIPDDAVFVVKDITGSRNAEKAYWSDSRTVACRVAEKAWRSIRLRNRRRERTADAESVRSD